MPRAAAMQALTEAQKIAFAPFAFQAARIMRDRGLLRALRIGEPRATADLMADTGLSEYATETLLEVGLSLGACEQRDGGWVLTRLGHTLEHDEMTRVNMDFTQDVCYQGLFELEAALVEGRPAGLHHLGPWPTIYPGLSQLPPRAASSWFRFDHFYSDGAMGQALPIVFARRPRRLLDVGGNTGKWARRCCTHDPDVHVTIADLPGQLALAREHLDAAGLSDRVTGHPIDLLDPDQALPSGHDAIWMSQFLCCFSKAEVRSILARARDALAPGGSLWILDTFWDNAPNPMAAWCLHATSLYFTAMANGNSRMYSLADTQRAIDAVGLRTVEVHAGLGLGHTLLRCEPA